MGIHRENPAPFIYGYEIGNFIYCNKNNKWYCAEITNIEEKEGLISLVGLGWVCKEDCSLEKPTISE